MCGPAARTGERPACCQFRRLAGTYLHHGGPVRTVLIIGPHKAADELPGGNTMTTTDQAVTGTTKRMRFSLALRADGTLAVHGAAFYRTNVQINAYFRRNDAGDWTNGLGFAFWTVRGLDMCGASQQVHDVLLPELTAAVNDLARRDAAQLEATAVEDRAREGWFCVREIDNLQSEIVKLQAKVNEQLEALAKLDVTLDEARAYGQRYQR